MNKATKLGLCILTVWLLGSLAIYATEKHDEAAKRSYDAYDTCVHAQYGVSVSSYYETNGVMPDCE